MKSLNPTQHACLEAMGIDVWVPREETEQADNTVAVEAVAAVKAAESPSVTEIETKTETVTELLAEPKSDPEPDIPEDWQGLQQAVSACQLCALHATRTQSIFGTGHPNASWLIIGDMPSEADDRLGDIFSDQSGELLTAMLKAIDLTRPQVYMANTLKCLPPNNRQPETDEADACYPYLLQQIKLIKPKLILVVGQSAAQRLLKTHSTIARLRQKVHTLEELNLPVVVTYHPAYLLNTPADKEKAWQDLLLAKRTMTASAVL